MKDLSDLVAVVLVEGTTGAYEDSSTWVVRAFASETKAQELVDRLNTWCKDHDCHFDGARHVAPDGRPSEDPSFYSLGTGVNYTLQTVPFTY